MEQVLHTFGVDWKLLLINAANFGLLLFVLWYFLYGPVTRMLEERRERVAKGVADAEAAERQLKEIEGSRAERLAHAGREADEVLASARAAGSQKQRAIVASAEATATSLLKEAGAQAKELKDTAVAEAREEVAKLVVLGMERMQLKGK
ncbi:MAG: F0F1 ATP synthase subunit B [Candidatus Adlerbacteria bacterium]|nr:F0F1 ATP synthase subunit B [Candidatus Adlerbacteria bacterium]